MFPKYFILQLLFITNVVNGSLDYSTITNFFKSFAEGLSYVSKSTPKEDRQSNLNICDENRLMFHLARIYVTSPERIMLLVTSESIPNMCENVGATISNIYKDFEACIQLSAENLYMRLFASVHNFYTNFCQRDDSRHKKLIEYKPCLQELHEDFLDCEGSADWFEKPNKTFICKTYLDIINCEYVKTAQLCGLDIAFILRSASMDVFSPLLPYKCELPKDLPIIVNTMPDTTFNYLRTQIVISSIVALCGTVLLLTCKYICKTKKQNTDIVL